MILRHDGLKYEGDNGNVYGILFDGAWLWEEYLNTLLCKHGFIRAENKDMRKWAAALSAQTNISRLLQRQ